MKRGESSSTGRGKATGKRSVNKGKVSASQRDKDDAAEEARIEPRILRTLF
jgi:hypothetical protein